MARVYAVEPWLRNWAGGDFEALDVASDVRDIDHLCDSLVKDLKKKATEIDGLLVVCADWKPFETSRRYELNGVRLLKHLRLTPELGDHRRMHAIVFSFEPVEELIRRQPGSQMLLTKGVTFLRLPEGLGCLKDETFLAHRAKALADLRGEDLMAAVRADYSPPDSAHAISNWFGVRQLLRGAAAVAKAPAVPELSAITAELKILNNKKALHLAEPSTPDLKEDLLRDARKEQKKLEPLLRPNPPKIVYVDDEMNNGWDSAVYLATIGEDLPNPVPSWFSTQLGQLASAKNQEVDWQTLAALILAEKPTVVLLDLRLLGGFESHVPIQETSGAKLIRLLRREAPAVPILLMTASNKFWTFQEAFRLGVDGYWSKEGIGEHAPPSNGVGNLISLVKQIRVLLGDDYQALRRVNDRVRNLSMLLTTPNPPWWAKQSWKVPTPPVETDPPQCTEPPSGEIFALLDQIAFMYREYLRLFHLGYGIEDVVSSASRTVATDVWLRSIAVQIGRVIELVHCFGDLKKVGLDNAGAIGGRYYPDKYAGKCFRKMRRDWFGQALYDIRNIAAHTAVGPDQFEPIHIRSAMCALVAWLSVQPKCEDYPAFLKQGRLPMPDDFFTGCDRQEDLVNSYTELFGSDQLCLPLRRNHST
jgi:CheY-like chemotaxis protein